MLTTAARWESSRIWRKSPGKAGLAVMLAYPVLFLAPFEQLGLFSTFFEGVLLFGWVYAFTIAAHLGADSGEFGNGAFWLYQKGISLSDYALARWLVVSAWGVGFIVFGLLVAAIGMSLYGELELRHVVAHLISGLLLFAVAQGWYFLAGALRLQRKSEVLLLLALITLTQGVLFRPLPSALRRVIHFMLLPMQDAVAAPTAMVKAEWVLAIENTLHVVLFVYACVAVSSFLHHRWRPFSR